MAIIGTAIRALALLVMYKISNPKIMPLMEPEKLETTAELAQVQIKSK